MRKLPTIGSANTVYERLAEYISGVDKEWKERIEPASEEEIENLYKYSKMKKEGIKFPDAYLTYLKYMGRDDGGLLKKGLYNSDSKIDVIINQYRELGEEDSLDEYQDELVDFANPYKFVFAYNEECEYAYYIYTKEKNQQIIISGDENKNGLAYFSESFEKLLFQMAFLNYERKYFRYEYSFGVSQQQYFLYMKKNKQKIFEKIDKELKKYDLERIWISDECHYFAANSDVSVGIWRETSLYVFVSGNNSQEVQEIGLLIEKIYK